LKGKCTIWGEGGERLDTVPKLDQLKEGIVFLIKNMKCDNIFIDMADKDGKIK
jgi:hypothetical protein